MVFIQLKVSGLPVGGSGPISPMSCAPDSHVAIPLALLLGKPLAPVIYVTLTW